MPVRIAGGREGFRSVGQRWRLASIQVIWLWCRNLFFLFVIKQIIHADREGRVRKTF